MDNVNQHLLSCRASTSGDREPVSLVSAGTLFEELEKTLLACQEAIVLRDAALIVELTSKARELHHRIAERWHELSVKQDPAGATSSRVVNSLRADFRASASAAAGRVLHLTKVQQFLIRRIEGHLQALRSAAAGAQRTYTAHFSDSHQPELTREKVGEPYSCRV
jgi:hypothetical protein